MARRRRRKRLKRKRQRGRGLKRFTPKQRGGRYYGMFKSIDKGAKRFANWLKGL